MSDESKVTSRIPGFYRKPVPERLAIACETGLLSPESTAHLAGGGGLPHEIADRMSENVISVHGLPLALGLNFRVNHRDVLVPMAVEEPSVVAAASNAAHIVRMTGGFFGEASAPVMTTQLQLDDVPDASAAPACIEAARARILAEANLAIPRMVARGGGALDLDVRVLDVEAGIVVVHIYVNVGNAMAPTSSIPWRSRSRRSCSH
jgi:hydroxymethylglutaryl-CoA reductase